MPRGWRVAVGAVVLWAGCGRPVSALDPGPAPAPAPVAPAPAPVAPAAVGDAPAPLDLSQDGTWTSGRWEYRFRITAKGSRSEGERGELLYDGVPVPQAVVGDHYQTPWGEIGWVGDPPELWGAHGWFPRAPGTTGGRLLTAP